MLRLYADEDHIHGMPYILALLSAFPSFFPNKIGAIVVNVAVLVTLLWLEWPTESAIGY